VVQEAFQKLARTKPNRVTCVHSLAFKIVQNCAFIRVRRNKRRQSLQFDRLPTRETYLNFVEPDPSQLEDAKLSDKLPFRKEMKSEEWFLNRERWQIIQDILPLLTERERILLEGRFMHGLTYTELAKKLHVHRVSIARLVENVMTKVKRLIEGRDAT
jgi:RNA polymerase sigma factor (sigma-70 family)